jgi:hypothetical protein
MMVFSDCELLGDITSTCGLREHQHLARFRSCPAGGRLFGGACAPVLIASRTPPNRVEAAVRNRIVAGYELSRPHPYSKPPAVSEYVLARVCRQSDLVLDPVAGSGSSRTAAEAVRHSVLASRRDGGGGGH